MYQICEVGRQSNDAQTHAACSLQVLLYQIYHLHRISEACAYCPDACDIILPDKSDTHLWCSDGLPLKYTPPPRLCFKCSALPWL